MRFELNVKTSKTFPEVKIFQPEPFQDERGDIWTLWEKEHILPKGLEFRLCKIQEKRLKGSPRRF